MLEMGCCHQQPLKGTNGESCKVSKKLGAIQALRRSFRRPCLTIAAVKYATKLNAGVIAPHAQQFGPFP